MNQIITLIESGNAGLLIMKCDAHGGDLNMTHICNIPSPCCPISKNPKAGSTISFTYKPNGWVVEVYSLQQLVMCFVGGYPGNDFYPAERNMEGMCQLQCRMVADAISIHVSYLANINQDCGGMKLTGSFTT